MDLKQRIDVFVDLGIFLNDFLRSINENSGDGKFNELESAINKAYLKNGWFTRDNVILMLEQINAQLSEKALKAWVSKYEIKEGIQKNIGIIMAGNIPLVGFNDLLCVLISGHKAKIKLSSDDEVLPRFIIDFLIKSNPQTANYIEICENRLKEIDAVIATGSNNSARYFNYYFGKYPHIIRKNRHSVGILNGNESNEDLTALGKDIFSYFGLGCRNVSKLYVPVNYNFNQFFEQIVKYGEVVNNNKYGNNYDYNRAVYLLNSEPFLDNNFLIIKENNQLGTPVSVLHYEYYQTPEDLNEKIKLLEDEIQCIVSKDAWYKNSYAFGNTQCPNLFDYADGVDTMKFLLNLNQ